MTQPNIGLIQLRPISNKINLRLCHMPGAGQGELHLLGYDAIHALRGSGPESALHDPTIRRFMLLSKWKTKLKRTVPMPSVRMEHCFSLRADKIRYWAVSRHTKGYVLVKDSRNHKIWRREVQRIRKS